jgi:peptidoglycan/xylan/chitin deacetylase (PgdA/CDA1 family)
MDSRRAPVAAAALASLLASSSPVQAGNWPQPAMGPSRSGDPEIVLTFDDGPHPRITPQLLDMLQVHDLHAVFFWVGWRLERVPDDSRKLIQRAVAEGHVVANHTINHAQLCTVEPDVGAHEIDGARALLEEMAQMPIVWFRSPYGARCLRIEMLLAARNLQHFHWDLDPQEWRSPSAKKTIAYVTHHLAQLNEGQRAVLLLHDTKVSTLHALPKILDWIVAENKLRVAAGRKALRFVSAPELAFELLDPDLRGWLDDTARRTGTGLGAALSAVMP